MLTSTMAPTIVTCVILLMELALQMPLTGSASRRLTPYVPSIVLITVININKYYSELIAATAMHNCTNI